MFCSRVCGGGSSTSSPLNIRRRAFIRVPSQFSQDTSAIGLIATSARTVITESVVDPRSLPGLGLAPVSPLCAIEAVSAARLPLKPEGR
jgi:hypothetical protein